MNYKNYCFTEKENGCWEWEMAINKYGYGVLKINQKIILAHRFFYELFKGKIKNTIDHLCFNKKCVNPAHLEDVTQRINCQRRKSSKIDFDKANEIRQAFKNGKNQYLLANLYGIGQDEISRIVNNLRWMGGEIA